MFLDSLVGDASWRAKYAISRAGERLPWDLVEADIRATHPYKVLALRSMIAVPYFEKVRLFGGCAVGDLGSSITDRGAPLREGPLRATPSPPFS